jgi:ubiquinone/menaquinone biosynthesis C-methylase UbiE
MEHAERSYLPAMGKRWLLPLYDPLLKLLGVDKTKRRLIEQAELKSGFRVLDIGCGTGSLAVLIKRMHPEVEVIGVDPDPAALSVSERKASRAGLSIEFDRGFSDHLSYPDASFDRVFSSFMFHHLEPSERAATLREIRRVLKSGGSLHLLDFAPRDGKGHRHHRHHRSPHEESRFEGRVVDLMSEAGLVDAKEVAKGKIFFGPIAYYRADALK